MVQFSKVMDPISITSSTIQVTGGSQTVVPVSISLDPTTDSSPHAPGATSSEHPHDPGDHRRSPIRKETWSRRRPRILRPDLDLISRRPKSFSSAPQFNSMNVPTNTSIVVQWNKQMNTATILRSDRQRYIPV